MQYSAIFRAEPEGGYTVLVPALRGCITYGTTLAKARANAKDAIKAYMFSLRKHNQRIPRDVLTLAEAVRV